MCIIDEDNKTRDSRYNIEYYDDFDDVTGKFNSYCATFYSMGGYEGICEIILTKVDDDDDNIIAISLNKVYPEYVYCTGQQVENTTYTRNLDNQKVLHNYQVQIDINEKPVFEWNDNHTTAKLQIVCAFDDTHTSNIDANITSEVTIAPKCTVAGERTYTATVIYGGETYTSTATDEEEAPGHNWGEYVYDNDATSVADGHKTRYCTNDDCGASETILDDAHKAHGVHSFTNYESDNNATTEADGTKTAFCDYGCGESNTVIDEGSKLEKTPTSIGNINTDSHTHAKKYMKNGQLIIEKNGVKYDVAGKIVK